MAADRSPDKACGASEPGEHEVVNALRDALPTARHAAMLFDLVANLLGEEGMVETMTGGAIRFPFLHAGTGCA